jgi:hypothetical protein
VALSPEILQTLVYVGLVLAGVALKQFFPSVKLPTPTPPNPAAPPKSLRDQLAEILPDLLEQLLRKREQAAPVFQAVAEGEPKPIASPAISVSTSLHTISISETGAVAVSVK